MDFKALGLTLVVVLIALVIYDKFVKKMIIKDGFESDLDELDGISE